MKKKERLSVIRKYYPDATTTIDSINKLIDFVEEQLDLEPSQIMFADSTCSDDVNSIQFPMRAHEFLGPFKMGGLDGFPFTGLTGMMAFASHVPDDGIALIYYGPHIGITKTGVIGEIHRFGQAKNSGCCGAAKGALKNLTDGKVVAGKITEMDYQMNTIEQILLKEKDRVLNSTLPLYMSTEVIYEAIDKRINQLVEQTKYNCKYIMLVGGIIINGDSDMGSYTSVKRFDVIELETGQRKNCRENYFNKFSNIV